MVPKTATSVDGSQENNFPTNKTIKSTSSGNKLKIIHLATTLSLVIRYFSKYVHFFDKTYQFTDK